MWCVERWWNDPQLCFGICGWTYVCHCAPLGDTGYFGHLFSKSYAPFAFVSLTPSPLNLVVAIDYQTGSDKYGVSRGGFVFSCLLFWLLQGYGEMEVARFTQLDVRIVWFLLGQQAPFRSRLSPGHGLMTSRRMPRTDLIPPRVSQVSVKCVSFWMTHTILPSRERSAAVAKSPSPAQWIGILVLVVVNWNKFRDRLRYLEHWTLSRIFETFSMSLCCFLFGSERERRVAERKQCRLSSK